uniref:RRM domain-containing protein n=1 Tax=Caenorhabditis tropicalis TaxID=1561998 RepID=A0A1I7UQY1_9PELO
MIKLYGKPIKVKSAHEKNMDVGANIFIGNLDPEVDEKLLYDTFSAFGVILPTSYFLAYQLSLSLEFMQLSLLTQQADPDISRRR